MAHDEEESQWETLLNIVDAKLGQYKSKLAEREKDAKPDYGPRRNPGPSPGSLGAS